MIATEPATQRVIVGGNDDLLRPALFRQGRQLDFASTALSEPDARPGEDPQQARRCRCDHRSRTATRAASRCSSTSRSAPSLPARAPCFTTATWCSAAAGSSRRIAAAAGILGISRRTRQFTANPFMACAIPCPWLHAAIRPCDSQAQADRLSKYYSRAAKGGASKIADGVYESFARMLVVFSRFPDLNKSNIHTWIRYDGFEYFLEAKRRGKGVLFATAHMGAWELSAFAHALMAQPMNVVVRPLDNPLIDAEVERRRARLRQ